MKQTLHNNKTAFLLMQKMTKNLNKGFLFFTISLFIGMVGNATVKTSAGTGTSGTPSVWSAGASWVGGVAPATSDSVVIVTGDFVNISGSTVTRNAGTLTTVNGTLISSNGITMNGTMVVSSTGTYRHSINGNTIPAATWAVGSTCNITGIGGTAPGGLGQSFYNVIWNCTAQSTAVGLGGALLTIGGDFTVTSTNSQQLRLGSTQSNTLAVAGNLVINGGFLALNSGNGSEVLTVTGTTTISSGTLTTSVANNTGTPTMNLNGGLAISGGTLDMHFSGNTTNLGVVNLRGDFNMSGGTLAKTGTAVGAVFNFAKTGTQIFTKSAGTISGNTNFNVNSGAVVDFGTSVLNGATGTFTAINGSGLITKNTAGFSTTAATGTVQVTGTKTYNTGVDYTYDGTSAQVMGNGFTGARNLTFNNTSGATPAVTFIVDATITGNLTVTAGDIRNTSGSGKTITMTGAAPTLAVAGSITGTNVGGGNDLNLTYTNTSGTLTVNGAGSLCRFLNCTNTNTGSTIAVARTLEVMFGAFAQNGILQINSGGAISASGVAPTYGASSSLVYNSGTTYANSTEWNSSSATVGLGVPPNVTVQNNTTLTTSANRALTGTLTIASGSTVALAAGYTSGSSSIAGTLRIDNGGFCTPSASYTGSSSALVYNSAHAQGSPYGIGSEWPSSNMPATITIQNSTFVGLTSRTYDGNINIVSGGLRSNSGTQALTMSGTGKTLTNSGTMYGEFGGNIMQLNFTGSTTLAGSTGFIDARNTSVTGTLTCNGIGIQSNSGTGTFSLGAGATLKVSDTDGLYDGSTNNTVLRNSLGTLTSGNITLNGTSTIEYNNASGGQTVSALTYGNLLMSNTSGTQTAAGAIVCNGTLTVPSSTTLDMATNQLSGTFTPSGTGTIKTQNTGAIPIPSGKTWTQTIEYNASGNQTAVVGTYAGLTCSGSGTKTMAGDFATSGVLTLNGAKLSIAGNTLTLNGTVSGMSASNSLVGSSTSKLTVGSTSSVGTVFFDQTTSADVTTTTGTNALQNFVVSGSGGSVSLGNKVNLFDRLSVSAGTLNTGDVLVLRSVSSNTSYVDNVGGTISGEVTVERFMHKQQRGWRILTAPVTYNGITQGYISGNWQSNFGYGGNYGTRISAPVAANGIDDATTGSSLQKYNSTAGAWSKVSNTNTETQSGNSGNGDNKGFYLFVRGDRTVTPAGSTPNTFVTTTLAAKGKLQTGTQTLTFTGTANKSWLTGNPFACPVDMEAVAYTNIGNFVYVWDLNLTGSSANTTGNYATFDRTAWGSGPSAGTSTKYFQSGQGFFVVPNNASASLVFEEADKSTSANNNTALTGAANNTTDIFNIKLISVKADGSKVETDGVRAKYGANYSDDVDANDAAKWSTSGIENIALLRNSKSLSIESRPYITGVDYLNINLTGLSVGSNYEFKINPINFDATVSSCKLVDNFLNTETAISLTSITSIGFNVTSVAGSNAADRFKVVFNGAGSLPVCNIAVKAHKQNSGVAIEWENSCEVNIAKYEVEKSVDGSNFNKLSITDAKNGSSNNKYNTVDNTPVNGNNYYRVKTIQANDKVYYSNILIVNLKPQTTTQFSVYPNPVKGNTIGLQLNNMEAGKYTARLFNVSGQEIWNNTFNHNGNIGSISLRFSNALLSGTYQLTLTDAKGNSSHQTVIAE